VAKSTVHGLVGPTLPDGGRRPLFINVHPLVGVWVDASGA
jgi:hypothetical protein